MTRQYSTHSTMLHNKYTDKVVQPDLKLVDTLHKLLDMIPQDNLALSIDYCVAGLIRAHNPPKGQFMPEILTKDTSILENK